MPFAQIDERKTQTNQSKFRKTEYMNLGEGMHVLRILENPAHKHYTHFLGRSYIECLGNECPICENNKKLMFENSKEFRKAKGWNPRSERFYVNVLDKTNSKVCTACGVEEKNVDRLSCMACGTALPVAAPLNKVKVLAKGKGVFDDLNMLSATVRDVNDQEIDIRAYDWNVIVRGTAKDTVTTVSPRWIPGTESLPELGEGNELFDLSNACVNLSREEMLDVFNGANLKDVFNLRKASKELVAQRATVMPDVALMSDITSAVDAIFKS